MLPMFLGTVYLNERRKAWSALIIPSVAALLMFASFGGSLFYGMGRLVFYMLLFYLAWGLVCVFTPRLVWMRYIKLRDKIGGSFLFRIISSILAIIFVIRPLAKLKSWA